MSIYQLSEYGRAVQWATWRTIGGCGLPNSTQFRQFIKPRTTLGEIESACPATGRSLARFAAENLKVDGFAVPYGTADRESASNE